MINGKNIIQRGRFAVSPDTLMNETVGGTTIQSSLPYVADLDQFKVSIQKESGEWRLRMNKGVVEFRANQFNVDYHEITSAINLKVISQFNVYPNSSKTTGTAVEPSQGVEQDGYIKLETGYNYWVFLYSITPSWSSDVLPCTALDINSPQLVVCKESDDPNYIYYIWQNGGGVIFNECAINRTNIEVTTPTGTQNLKMDWVSNQSYFKQVDCCRHNIAHVIWDADKGWQVKQMQIGPCILQMIPQPGSQYDFITEDGIPINTQYIFDPATYSSAYQASQTAITGYTKNLTSTGIMSIQSVAPTGTQYLKAT